MTIVKELYGYDSPQNAYCVDDYPYGRKRCRIWFWIEFKPKKGYRFCSQTQNPNNGQMNKPKYSVYCLLGMNMFLDEKGHVDYAAITEYSSAPEVYEFVQQFPNFAGKQRLHDFCKAKYTAYKKVVETNINLFGKSLTETDKEDYNNDLRILSKTMNCLSQ